MVCPTEYRNKIEACTMCTLNKKENNLYPTQTIGRTTAALGVYAEAPGAEEEKQSIPLVGKAGQLVFQPALKDLGLGLEDIFVGNVVKHRPENNRNPTLQEMQACSQHVLNEIDYLEPRALLLMGLIPTQAFHLYMGKPIPKRSMRGLQFDFEHKNKTKYKVFVTHHPAYILYGGGRGNKRYEEFLTDFREAIQYARTSKN